MSTRFIAIGDTFKATRETFHFHRDMAYQVSHVFNDNGNFRFFIRDKKGYDVEYHYNEFEPTAKTVTASTERQKRAKIEYLWKNPSSNFIINGEWCREADRKKLYFNKSYIGSATYSGLQGSISIAGIEDSKASVRSVDELADYFKKLKVNIEWMNLDGLYNSTQENIDHTHFMLSLPKFDERVLNRPPVLEMTEIDWYVHRNPMPINVFLQLIGQVIFDEEVISGENVEIVKNVMEAYELLPKSFGPTGASKLLMGKEKKENQNVKHLSGTCTKLKQPQVFTLCNIVESYLYVNDVFKTKEDYGSGDEWRDQFEFIGSKAINHEKLNIIKHSLA